MEGIHERRAARAALALAAALLLVGGCAYRNTGLANEAERVVRSTRHSVREGAPAISVTQEGARVHVRAEQRCRTHRRDVVETTRAYGRHSTAPGPYITAGIIGALSGAAGGLLAANVFGFSPARGPGDSLTPDEALVVGVTLISAGTIALLVAASHGFVLLGTDDEVSTSTVERGAVGEPAPCDPRVPVAAARVAVGTVGNRVEVGQLGPSGELTFDATRMIPPHLVMDQLGGELPLQVAGHGAPRGVATDPLVETLEERSWESAEVAQCAAAEQPQDCAGLERYLRLFPRGAHADRARTILGPSRDRLAERARQLAEERRAEAERRRLERQRQRLAEEQRLRELQEQWEAEERARQAEAEARRRARRERAQREARRLRAQREARRQRLRREAARREARRQCLQACAQSCAGSRECVEQCAEQRCR